MMSSNSSSSPGCGALDILEDDIQCEGKGILDLLLKDRSTGRNILWATGDYEGLGSGYAPQDELRIDLITGNRNRVIQPRIAKSMQEQERRTRQKAEVFTPAWVCNKQNNLVDAAWFGRKAPIFNREIDTADCNTWKSVKGPVRFTTRKTWQMYVKAPRLEIACGEAPYLVSRYDNVTGAVFPVEERIGLLDRKLRAINENVGLNRAKWRYWTLRALQSIYGYEYQGDNVLLARENILWTVRDNYYWQFAERPPRKFLLQCAEVVSWNIWQMDGIKFVVPGSCHPVAAEKSLMFGFMNEQSDDSQQPCPGCQKNDVSKHNGTRCRIMAWRTRKQCYFMPPFRFEPIEENK